MKRNQPNRMDGRTLLGRIKTRSVSLVVFDPQYRAVLDKLGYGNEGKRQGARHALKAMSDKVIADFIIEIERVLKPSGHLMLWLDKFSLASAHHMVWSRKPTDLKIVDMISWNKGRIGMGYRARGCMEYLLVIQKAPIRAKGCWHTHSLPDGWLEYADRSAHPHAKPLALQQALIRAATKRGDLVVDPAAGGYSVLQASRACGRDFLGCDLVKPAIGSGA